MFFSKRKKQGGSGCEGYIQALYPCAGSPLSGWPLWTPGSVCPGGAWCSGRRSPEADCASDQLSSSPTEEAGEREREGEREEEGEREKEREGERRGERERERERG